MALRIGLYRVRSGYFRTEVTDVLAMFRLQARPLAYTTSSMQVRPRPVATSHIPADIRERLVFHDEGASWVGSPLPYRGAIIPERRA
jgi:hypothetical protein